MRSGWDDYFMDIAREVATRATCDRKHVGAVIVRDKTILSTGYNGSVRGTEHCDEAGHLMVEGHCVRTVHAELNAILQAAKNGTRIDQATIYVTASPCWACFGPIANAGIVRIVFGEAYRPDDDGPRRVRSVAGQIGIDVVDLSEARGKAAPGPRRASMPEAHAATFKPYVVIDDEQLTCRNCGERLRILSSDPPAQPWAWCPSCSAPAEGRACPGCGRRISSMPPAAVHDIGTAQCCDGCMSAGRVDGQGRAWWRARFDVAPPCPPPQRPWPIAHIVDEERFASTAEHLRLEREEDPWSRRMAGAEIVLASRVSAVEPGIYVDAADERWLVVGHAAHGVEVETVDRASPGEGFRSYFPRSHVAAMRRLSSAEGFVAQCSDMRLVELRAREAERASCSVELDHVLAEARRRHRRGTLGAHVMLFIDYTDVACSRCGGPLDDDGSCHARCAAR